MKVRATEYYEKAKVSATDKVNHINMQIVDIKETLFNMNLPQNVEIALRNRIRVISIAAGFVALLALFVMSQTLLYLVTALSAGFIAMFIDFVIEYLGIRRNAWDYPVQYLSFRRVPIEVPLLFFSCGILATFAVYCFSAQPMITLITAPAIAGLSLVQFALILTGIFFMFQYIRGAVKSLVFWALPISIALYLSFPEPWILVIAILPMYIDYYLEKRLVQSASIKYDRYGHEVAINVAISYFPATLFIFGVIALFLYLLNHVI